jgi:hypothetical protein
MNVCRTTAVGLVAMACISVTACTTPGTTPAGGSTNSTQSASNDLRTALATIGTTSYHITVMQRGLTGSGAVDPVAKNASIELKGLEQGTAVDIQALQIAGDLYAKFDAGAAIDAQAGIDPTKWMKVDQSRLIGPNATPFDTSSPDALDVAGLVTGLVDVRRTSATELTGTVDLTKATGVNAPTAAELASAGAAAATTPFVATLDAQGRLVELKIDADAFAKDLTFDIVFSAFGSAIALAAPAAADVVPAPDALYQLMNG